MTYNRASPPVIPNKGKGNDVTQVPNKKSMNDYARAKAHLFLLSFDSGKKKATCVPFADVGDTCERLRKDYVADDDDDDDVEGRAQAFIVTHGLSEYLRTQMPAG